MTADQLDLSPDEVRIALREYLADHPGLAQVRAVRDGDAELAAAGFDRGAWTILAAGVGIAGLGAPAWWGGLQLGPDYLVAAAEECGVGLYPGPARAALLTGQALAGLDQGSAAPELAELVGRFLAGGAIPGIPLSGTTDDLPEFADHRLRGRAVAVTHGAVADLLLCPVRTAHGPAVALAAVGAAAERVARRSVDLSTPRADIVVDGAVAALLTDPADRAAPDHFGTMSRLLLAAEQVGGAEGCLAAMVDHAKTRRQFGELIGSYQAIQHRCARTAVAIVSARSLVAAGAHAAAAGDAATARQLSLLARAEASECFNAAADSLIQVSGGIGFTWEHDAHLFYRRARAAAAVGGGPERLRAAAVRAGCVGLLDLDAPGRPA